MADHKTQLVTLVDGVERARVAPPSRFPSRDWLLGVVAVQVTIVEGRPCAIVRSHITGDRAPVIVPLGERAVVSVALVDAGAEGRACDVELPPLDGARARLGLFVNEVAIADACLERADDPRVRAFSHVYCRWLRDGARESGADLTDFLALPPGVKYERIAARPIACGDIVTMTWRAS